VFFLTTIVFSKRFVVSYQTRISLENIVRPPVDSEGIVVVRDDFRLWRKLFQFKIFLKKLIKLLEAYQTKLTKAKLHNLILFQLRAVKNLSFKLFR